MFDWLDAGAHLGQHPGGGAAPSLVFERWLLAGLRPSARLGFVGRPADTGTADCRAAGAALKWPAPAGFSAAPWRRGKASKRLQLSRYGFLVCYMSSS